MTGRATASQSAAFIALVILALSCSSDLVEVPAFAVAVSGPAVLDETGLVADWELIGGPDEELPYQTGPYEGDFGVVPVTPGPNPVEHCAAVAIGYGLRLVLSQPVGDRSITARLIDPVNQQPVEFT